MNPQYSRHSRYTEVKPKNYNLKERRHSMAYGPGHDGSKDNIGWLTFKGVLITIVIILLCGIVYCIGG